MLSHLSRRKVRVINHGTDPNNDDDDIVFAHQYDDVDDKQTPATDSRPREQQTDWQEPITPDDQDQLNPNDTATLIFSITTAVILAVATALALYFTVPAIPVLGLILGGIAATIMLTITIRAITKYSMRNDIDYTIDDLNENAHYHRPTPGCTSVMMVKLRNLFTHEDPYGGFSPRPGSPKPKQLFSKEDYVPDEELAEVINNLTGSYTNLVDPASDSSAQKAITRISSDDDLRLSRGSSKKNK